MMTILHNSSTSDSFMNKYNAVLMTIFVLFSITSINTVTSQSATQDDCPEINGNSTKDRFGCLDSDGDGWSNPDNEWTINNGADVFIEDSTQWKDFDKDGFTFYTNLDSPKSIHIEKNPKAEMCFYWKSLQRQVRVFGSIDKVSDEVADKYFSSRGHESKIGAWASEQSKVLRNRSDLLERIDGFKKTYSEKKNVPRPENWSGWILQPIMIEFWLKGSHRIHERLRYHKESNNWIKKLLNP